MDRGLLLSALATDPAPKATVAPAVVADKALLKEVAMANNSAPLDKALLKEAAMADSSALALLKEAAMADSSALSLHK